MLTVCTCVKATWALPFAHKFSVSLSLSLSLSVSLTLSLPPSLAFSLSLSLSLSLYLSLTLSLPPSLPPSLFLPASMCETARTQPACHAVCLETLYTRNCADTTGGGPPTESIMLTITALLEQRASFRCCNQCCSSALAYVSSTSLFVSQLMNHRPRSDQSKLKEGGVTLALPEYLNLTGAHANHSGPDDWLDDGPAVHHKLDSTWACRVTSACKCKEGIVRHRAPTAGIQSVFMRPSARLGSRTHYTTLSGRRGCGGSDAAEHSHHRHPSCRQSRAQWAHPQTPGGPVPPTAHCSREEGSPAVTAQPEVGNISRWWSWTPPDIPSITSAPVCAKGNFLLFSSLLSVLQPSAIQRGGPPLCPGLRHHSCGPSHTTGLRE